SRPSVVLYSWLFALCFFFFSSRRRHTRFSRDWSSDVCSSDLACFMAKPAAGPVGEGLGHEAGLLAMSMGHALDQALVAHRLVHRSEERRVGKEGRSRWGRCHEEKRGKEQTGNV